MNEESTNVFAKDTSFISSSGILDEDNISISNKSKPFYFYHLAPKNIVGSSILSPYAMYNKNSKMFNDVTDKYRDRMCNGWGICQGRDPESLTSEEIYNGLIKFRGMNGTKMIYFFKYPPYKELGRNMRNVLKDKDIYRININDPKVMKLIEEIDWGYEGSFTENKHLDRSYYENVTREDYFKNYNDNAVPLFASINHISIAFRNGVLPLSYMEKVDINSLNESATESSNMSKIRSVANEIANHVKKNKQSNNCNLCSMCFEINMRGGHKLPRAVNTPRDISQMNEKIGIPVQNYRSIKIPTEDGRDFVKKTVAKYDDGARFIVKVGWKGKKSGHIFNIVNIKGEAWIVDCTDATIGTVDRLGRDYLFDIDPERSYMVYTNFEGSKLNEDKIKYLDEKYAIDWKDGDEKLLESATEILNEEASFYSIYPSGSDVLEKMMSVLGGEVVSYSNMLTWPIETHTDCSMPATVKSDHPIDLNSLTNLGYSVNGDTVSKNIGDYRVTISYDSSKKDKNITFIVNKVSKSMNESIEILNEGQAFTGKLYLLSEKNLDGETLIPEVPDNYMTRNGYEENTTKRVCFCDSIENCLMAMNKVVLYKRFYVHMPVEEPKYRRAFKKDVPAADLTHEVWVREPVKVKCVGIVGVDEVDEGSEYDYEYGNGQKGILYHWYYYWVEKYEEGLDESTMTIANISPIVTGTKFLEEKNEMDTTTDFDKELEALKRSLNEGYEEHDFKIVDGEWGLEDDSITPFSAKFCPETLSERNDKNLLNRVKRDIVSGNAVEMTIDNHHGKLYAASDFHIYGVWHRFDANQNFNNIKDIAKVINEINSVVGEDDTLVICGDLGYKLDPNLKKNTTDFVKGIKCKHLILVLGNHDLLSHEEYYEIGFEKVCNRLSYGQLIFTHYPIDCPGFINIHGHIHEDDVTKYDNINHDHKVKVDYHVNKTPVRISKVIMDMIESGDIKAPEKLSDETKAQLTELHETANRMMTDSLNEQAVYDEEHTMPIFIVLMHSGTNFANLIKKATREPFSHAAISLNPTLEPIYEFDRIGFHATSRTSQFFEDHPDANFAVYVVFLTKKEYMTIIKNLDYFMRNKDRMTYDTAGAVLAFMHINSQRKYSYFCSSFVAKLLGDVRELSKKSGLYLPMDLSKLDYVTCVNGGKDIRKYDTKTTLRNLDAIRRGQHSKIVLESYEDTTTMFGDGVTSAITDNKMKEFSRADENNKNEDADAYTPLFSPNHTKPGPSYIDSTDNFESNENGGEIIADMKNDAYTDDAGISPSVFAKDTYAANFDVGE